MTFQLHRITLLGRATARLAMAFCCAAAVSCAARPEEEAGMRIGDWTWECDSDLTKVTCSRDTLEIISPGGNTVWYKRKLEGAYRISYQIAVADAGGEFDRLSDLNCFWGATDPAHPDSLFAGAARRRGVFRNYDALDLFYCGFGGNDNSTTRFRKYHGEGDGADRRRVRPILREYTQLPDLLEGNHWYKVEILVAEGETRFTIDGRTLFAWPLEEGEGDGHFGLRFWKNHVRCTGFRVETLPPRRGNAGK